jgi:hypothetical protein
MMARYGIECPSTKWAFEAPALPLTQPALPPSERQSFGLVADPLRHCSRLIFGGAASALIGSIIPRIRPNPTRVDRSVQRFFARGFVIERVIRSFLRGATNAGADSASTARRRAPTTMLQ